MGFHPQQFANYDHHLLNKQYPQKLEIHLPRYFISNIWRPKIKHLLLPHFFSSM